MLQEKTMEELTKYFKARIMPLYKLRECILKIYVLNAIFYDTIMDPVCWHCAVVILIFDHQ